MSLSTNARTRRPARWGIRFSSDKGISRKAFSISCCWVRLSPNDIVKDVEKYLEIGIDHIVFDLRFRFDEWDQCMNLIGKEVLPKLHKHS